METTGLFSQINQDAKFTQLCLITKDRIESFLPGLWDELFKSTSLSSTSKLTESNEEQQKPIETTTTEQPHAQQQLNSNEFGTSVNDSNDTNTSNEANTSSQVKIYNV